MKQTNIKLIINNKLYDCVVEHENGQILELCVLYPIGGLSVPHFAGYLLETERDLVMWQIVGEL